MCTKPEKLRAEQTCLVSVLTPMASIHPKWFTTTTKNSLFFYPFFAISPVNPKLTAGSVKVQWISMSRQDWNEQKKGLKMAENDSLLSIYYVWQKLKPDYNDTSYNEAHIYIKVMNTQLLFIDNIVWCFMNQSAIQTSYVLKKIYRPVNYLCHQCVLSESITGWSPTTPNLQDRRV